MDLNKPDSYIKFLGVEVWCTFLADLNASWLERAFPVFL